MKLEKSTWNLQLTKDNMFPKVLYKAFSHKEHAISFCRGKMRFSTLRYYKEMESDVRADSGEGLGEVRRNGEQLIVDVKKQVIHSTPGIENLIVNAADQDRFICCFSSPKNGDYSALTKKFGNYLVKINSPENLFYGIENSIRDDDNLQKNSPYLEGEFVRYDKGYYVDKLNDKEIIKLAWTQKSLAYAEEYEYRLQFYFSFSELIGSPQHYVVNLNKNLDYCEVIEN